MKLLTAIMHGIAAIFLPGAYKKEMSPVPGRKPVWAVEKELFKIGYLCGAHAFARQFVKDVCKMPFTKISDNELEQAWRRSNAKEIVEKKIVTQNGNPI